jgi:hypothetical protein
MLHYSNSGVECIHRILSLKLSNNSVIRKTRTEAKGAKLECNIKQPQDLNQIAIPIAWSIPSIYYMQLGLIWMK